MKRGAAVAFGALLLLSASVALISRTGGGMFSDLQDVTGPASLSEVKLLLAKTTGLSNPDEAKVLLEALQDGSLDSDDVSFALEADASRKAAEIKAAAEAALAAKVAEEKAAAEKAAAAVKAAAEKAEAERAIAAKEAALKAMRAAAEKAAAGKSVAEKKAAAERTSSRFVKLAPQSIMDDVFDDNEEEDELFWDGFEDKEDFLRDDFEDDEYDEENTGLLSAGGLKRVFSYKKSRGEFSPLRENRHVPTAKISRDGLDRRRSPTLFDAEEENEREDTEQWQEEDDEDGDAFTGGSSPFHSEMRRRSSRTATAAANDRRQGRKGSVGHQRGDRAGGVGRGEEETAEANPGPGPRRGGVGSSSSNRRSRSSGRTRGSLELQARSSGYKDDSRGWRY